jgi:hypothetical protein
VSSFRIAKYQIFAISDVNNLVTPVSVTAALPITVPADQQLLPEETVHLCTVLKTGAEKQNVQATFAKSQKTSSSSSPKETIIVCSTLLSHTVAIPFDAKHTLIIDAQSFLNRLSPFLNISHQSINHTSNPTKTTFLPLLPSLVTGLQMETLSTTNTLSYMRTTSTARLDRLSQDSKKALRETESCRKAISDSSGKMGFISEEIFRNNLADEEGIEFAERLRFWGLGDLVRRVGRRLKAPEGEAERA